MPKFTIRKSSRIGNTRIKLFKLVVNKVCQIDEFEKAMEHEGAHAHEIDKIYAILETMKTREDLLNSPTFWLTKVQIEVFGLLNSYMQENNLSQKQVAEKLNVSPSYVSQILNGNFNFTISKLIELALLVGKAPVLQFELIDNLLEAEIAQQADLKPAKSRRVSGRQKISA